MRNSFFMGISVSSSNGIHFQQDLPVPAPSQYRYTDAETVNDS